MGINLWILYDDLAEFQPELYCNKPVTNCPLTYFSFYRPNSQMAENCLYIVKPEQLAEAATKCTDASFLCLGKCDIPRYDVSVLWVQDADCSTTLIAKLAELFHLYMDWLSSLERAIYQKKPLDEFGRLSLPFFRRPISLFKYNFFTLFSVYDECYGPMPKDYYQYTVGTYLSNHIMEETEENLPAVIAKRGPYKHQSSSGVQVLCINLWYQDRFIGELQVDELGSPVTNREHSLISLLGDFLMRSIKENSLINFSLNSDLQSTIYDLLDHRVVDSTRLKESLATIGWNPEETFSCIVCRPCKANIPGDALFLRGETLSQVIPCSIYIIYQNQILLFCNQSRLNKEIYIKALKELHKLLKEMQFLAGISNNYEAFDKSGYFYKASVSAILYGTTQYPHQNLYYYEEYMVDIFCNHLLSEMIQDVFIPTELLRLIQYDRQTNGDYCKVLYALLRNNMSCTDAARELFTHRNTVLNRLNRMKEYFHMDLDNHLYRLKLTLAFQILENHNTPS